MKRLFLSAIMIISALTSVAQNKIEEGTITSTVEWKSNGKPEKFV